MVKPPGEWPTMPSPWPEGTRYYDAEKGIWYVGKNGYWLMMEGQRWRDPQTNIIYTWLTDRWVQTTDFERVKEIIQRLRVLGLPAEVITELEDWVREQGGYNA